jgi:hypothetical protein
MRFRRDGKKRQVKDRCGGIEKSVPNVGPRPQIGSNRSEKTKRLDTHAAGIVLNP